MKQKDLSKSKVQLIWGIALMAMGTAVFLRVPQVMPKLEQMGQFGGFARFGLYLMGVILIGGGIKKIIAFTKPPETKPDAMPDINDSE